MRDIVDEIGTGHDAVPKIIKELGYSKVCARWVPRMLTDELRQSRREVCTQMLQRYKAEGENYRR